LAVALVSEFTALYTNPKAPLVAGLGWVGGVMVLGYLDLFVVAIVLRSPYGN
jgi:hypothetical protein